MSNFYKIKRFLMRIGVLGYNSNFAFNLSHIRLNKAKKQNCFVYLSTQELGMIFSFLGIKEVKKIKGVSSQFAQDQEYHVESRLALLLVEIESIKLEMQP